MRDGESTVAVTGPPVVAELHAVGPAADPVCGPAAARRRKRTGPERSQGRFGLVMVSPAVLVMLALGAYPVFTGIVASFTNEQLSTAPYHFVGFGNYQALFSDSTFGRVVINTLLWTSVGTCAALAMSTGLALLLAQHRHNAAFQLLWLIPWAMPQVTLAITFNWLYLPLVGFLPNWASFLGFSFPALLASPNLALWAVLVPAVWTTYSFGMLFIQAALLGIDPSVIEAAEIDGASRWQQFRHIKTPVIGSVIRVVALLDFLWLFNQFAVIWVMTKGGPADHSQILGSYAYYVGILIRNVGGGTAVGVVMLVMLLAFVLVFLRLARRSYGGLGV